MDLLIGRKPEAEQLHYTIRIWEVVPSHYDKARRDDRRRRGQCRERCAPRGPWQSTTAWRWSRACCVARARSSRARVGICGTCAVPLDV